MTKTKRKKSKPQPVIIPAQPGYATLSYDGNVDEVQEDHVLAWAVWPGQIEPLCLDGPCAYATGLRRPDGSVVSLGNSRRVYRDTGSYLAYERRSYRTAQEYSEAA